MMYSMYRQQIIIFLTLLLSVFSSSLWAQNLQTGDIIFHTSRSAQSAVIQKATHSPYSHMGLIVQKNHQWWVLEAVQPVKYTPLKTWIARGVKGHYVVKRYHKNLTTVQQQRLIQTAERSLGKPYDLHGMIRRFIVRKLCGKLINMHWVFNLHLCKNCKILICLM